MFIIAPITDQKEKLGNAFKFKDMQSVVATVFNVIISLAGAVFMLMLLIGGFMYLTGAGNEEQTSKAKKMMLDSAIGLALTLSAFALGKTVLGWLS
ncbi:MAG: Uncharacterized protein CEN91_368 [Candidatus Berkelbacteria bacterium Licking1014_85]|uniref:TrbC/VIRB2 family protein n=1 Tax=Candidatus Berkelbacteria bacterium Licking1014_85 TaxID=2017148 RepID=A0A554LIY8_9BACT|nr:MAG: Uncharacterized protein CEN91_368 [Candidatus Berkelbacteria bacterium Licking1014_85]